jgi:hypothetical protein
MTRSLSSEPTGVSVGLTEKHRLPLLLMSHTAGVCDVTAETQRSRDPYLLLPCDVSGGHVKKFSILYCCIIAVFTEALPRNSLSKSVTIIWKDNTKFHKLTTEDSVFRHSWRASSSHALLISKMFIKPSVDPEASVSGFVGWKHT